MTWGEHKGGWWTIPAERIKTAVRDGENYSVSIAATARAILDAGRTNAPQPLPLHLLE
jgi:hypothetical protein